MKDKIIMLSGEVQYHVTVENPHEVVLDDNKSIFIAYANDIMVALSDEHIKDDNDILTWKEVPEELEGAIIYCDTDNDPYCEKNSILFN